MEKDLEATTESEQQAPIEVPFLALSPEALQGVVEAFILREGTDYGAQEISLEKKIENIRNQMQRGETFLVFDPGTESLTFISRAQRLKWKSAHLGCQ